MYVLGGYVATQENMVLRSKNGKKWENVTSNDSPKQSELYSGKPDNGPCCSNSSGKIMWKVNIGLTSLVFKNKMWVIGGFIGGKQVSEVW